MIGCVLPAVRTLSALLQCDSMGGGKIVSPCEGASRALVDLAVRPRTKREQRCFVRAQLGAVRSGMLRTAAQRSVQQGAIRGVAGRSERSGGGSSAELTKHAERDGGASSLHFVSVACGCHTRSCATRLASRRLGACSLTLMRKSLLAFLNTTYVPYFTRRV